MSTRTKRPPASYKTSGPWSIRSAYSGCRFTALFSVLYGHAKGPCILWLKLHSESSWYSDLNKTVNCLRIISFFLSGHSPCFWNYYTIMFSGSKETCSIKRFFGFCIYYTIHNKKFIFVFTNLFLLHKTRTVLCLAIAESRQITIPLLL